MRKRITGWRVGRRWPQLALVACLALVSAGAVGAAFARSRHGNGESPASEKAGEPAAPAGPLFFVISTNKQHVSVYGKNGLYEVSPVSTGRPDHPTPHGIFSIIGKERYHHSNIYSGAPMPFMQRITWSGVAMHEGVLPGYAASHGCVRLPHEFAQRLFRYTEGNERVVISHQDIVPASIAHPRLFEPKLMEAPGPGVASGSGQMLQNAIAVTQSARPAGDAQKLDVAVKPDGPDAAQAATGQKLLNPHEFAKAMKSRAAKQADEAAAALSPARNAIEAKAKEVKEAAFAVRKAEIALASAKDAVETAGRRVAKAAAGEEAAKAAADAKAQAEAKLAEAEAALSEAQRVKSEKDQDAAPVIAGVEAKAKEVKEAALAVHKAETALAEAKDLLESADRRVKRTGVEAGASKDAAEAKAQAEARIAEAEAALSAAQRTKTGKEQDAAPVLAAMEAKAKESKEAALAVHKAENALAEARDLLEMANRRVRRTARDEEASKAAGDAKLQAGAKVAEAEAALSEAQRLKAGKDRDAAPAIAAMEANARESKEAALAVRKAEIALAGAKDAAETAGRRVAKAAAGEEAAQAAVDAKVQAEAKAGEAEAALSEAQRLKSEKDRDAAPVLAAMEAKASESKEAALAVHKAEIALANAKDGLENADRRVKRTAVEAEAPKAAADAKAQAEARIVEAEAALSAAQLTKAEKERDAASALKAYKDADYTSKAAADAAKSWNRRLAPLSIFVSRKTQRLYIKQGHIRVFDVPVTVRDPEKPLGTHVYVAMPPQDAQGSPSSLRWLVLTIPDASADTEEPRRHRRRHNDDDEAPAAAIPAASASEALDRIEVTPEVREKISEMLWAGSSLIVSDKAISGETDDSTDFIILTR